MIRLNLTSVAIKGARIVEARPPFARFFLTTKRQSTGGVSVLIEKGSPISYLGERRYTVSEDDRLALKSRSVGHTPLK